MQGNIKIIKSAELPCKEIVIKKLSIEKNSKIRNILFLEIITP